LTASDAWGGNNVVENGVVDSLKGTGAGALLGSVGDS
jgi:hypothetical protein